MNAARKYPHSFNCSEIEPWFNLLLEHLEVLLILHLPNPVLLSYLERVKEKENADRNAPALFLHVSLRWNSWDVTTTLHKILWCHTWSCPLAVPYMHNLSPLLNLLPLGNGEKKTKRKFELSLKRQLHPHTNTEEHQQKVEIFHKEK